MAAPQQQQQQHQHQPPPPDGDEWLDAQPFLAAVCGGMGVGELLHGPSFSLFESTTAIEIGDPKMDIGLQRGEESGSPEELIAAGAAPVTPPPPQLLAILDRLLVAEAAWHKGAMLPQTVFSSLYMLRPDRCVQACAIAAMWGWWRRPHAELAARCPRLAPQAGPQRTAARLLPRPALRLLGLCRHGARGGGDRGGGLCFGKELRPCRNVLVLQQASRAALCSNQ